MKRILLALAMLALVSPALPRANGAEIGIDFFYDNLLGGSWLEVDGYGYCWQPDVAVNDPDWRPYSDGYWAYTDVGWTWMSYEDFGWATYHYGRWAKLADYGWVWVPGSEWGPAWVSWRTGGDYIGWAPLPPRGPGVVYEGQPIDAQVDIEFDIGPEYYNFCDVRYIGEPVLRHRIVPVRQNVTYIDRTINVTRITVTNNVVYNYGPDINVVNEHSSRPIQRLHLQREQNVDLVAAAKSGGITKVQGNALVVAAPTRINKSAGTAAPPKIKGRVQQAKIEKGWAGIDPNEQTKIKEKFKNEDRSKASGFGTPEKTGSPITASPTGDENRSGEFQGTDRNKAKQGGKVSQSAMAPANSPSAAVSPTISPEHGKHQGRHVEPLATSPPVPTPTAGRETSPTGPNENVQSENPNRAGGKNTTESVNAPTGTPSGERPHERKPKGSPSPTPQ